MANELTFAEQLQALASVTSDFANSADSQIKNTIITALGGSTQQGGGTTPAKTEPTLTIDTSEGGGSYTYNGDGIVFGYAAWNGDGSFPLKFKLDRSAKTFNVFPDSGYDYHIWIYASEGDTYAAKTAHGSYQD